jgi:hypothetical protein
VSFEIQECGLSKLASKTGYLPSGNPFTLKFSGSHEFFFDEFTMSRTDTLYLELVAAAVDYLSVNTGLKMLFFILGEPSAEEPRDITRGLSIRPFSLFSFFGFKCGK